MPRACPPALLGDASMIGGTWPGLPDAGVQPEIADKLLWLIETGYLADRRLHRQRHGHVDAGNGHQPLHAIIGESRAGGEKMLRHMDSSLTTMRWASFRFMMNTVDAPSPVSIGCRLVSHTYSPLPEM